MDNQHQVLPLHGIIAAVDYPYSNDAIAFPDPSMPEFDDLYELPDIDYEEELARSIQLALDPQTYEMEAAPEEDPLTLGHGTSEEDDQLLKKALSRLRAGEKVTLAKGEPVHIGIDSEYVFNPKTTRNEILSYQFYLISEMGTYLFGHYLPQV